MEAEFDFQNVLEQPIGLITRCILSKCVEVITSHQVI